MNARMPEAGLAAPVHTLYGQAVRARTGTARLGGFDADAARACEGVAAVVVRGNFVGVVAQSPQQVERAIVALRPRWEVPTEAAAAPTRTASIASHGNAADVLAANPARVDAVYRWPLASLRADAFGSAVAEYGHGVLRVWVCCHQPAGLRLELSALLGIDAGAIVIVGDTTSHATGGDDNGDNSDNSAAHDPFCARQAAADAALMAHAVGGPVRTVFRAAELGDEAPKLSLAVSAALAPASAYAIAASAPPAAGLPLAMSETATAVPYADVSAADPTLVPPYAVEHLDVSASAAYHLPADAAARGHVFAHESHLDELASRADIDPVALRLQWLDDATGRGLIERVAAQSDWQRPRQCRDEAIGGIRRGRGFAYASVVDMEDGRPARAWSAWVADVEVDSRTGDISVTRVTVGHERERADAQGDARPGTLPDEIAFTARQLTAGGTHHDDWGQGAPAEAAHALAPRGPADAVASPARVDIVGTLAGGAAVTLPAAAAVANAIHDATGIRLREPPFTAGRMRRALEGAAAQGGTPRKRRWLLAALAPLTALAGLCATVMPWRAPIAPVAPPVPGFYSAATIERGRLVAAAGDCAVCHTAPGGARNAGGLALETPFGTVYSTNITPDAATGIGNWSYAAFERAMREGIHRDGRRLYPAFPYTAFAKVSDADMQALYAYLMAAEPVAARPPETRLAFPFNARPLLAGWNLLFHRNAQYVPDTTRSAQWNRGAYLAEGLGHCSACHSPRNALGAEKGGKAYLTGGTAEGWEAPALTALSKAPVPWTEDDLFQYLRTGFAARHGAAAGPMAPVVESLRALPEGDVRAIAHYVASFNAPVPAPGPVPQVEEVEARSAAAALRLAGATDRLYQSACAVCHQGDAGVPQFGVKPSLALNTNLHSDRPDNVIQAVLHGVAAPPHPDIGYMPGFADSLDDAQVTELVQYLRARFAPDAPPWRDVGEAVARVRAAPAH